MENELKTVENIEQKSEKELKIMKKKFKCEVDCANCAAKLEEAIRKVPGVEDANVNFLTQKLTLTAPDDQFDQILQAVVKTAKKVEPDTVIEI